MLSIMTANGYSSSWKATPTAGDGLGDGTALGDGDTPGLGDGATDAAALGEGAATAAVAAGGGEVGVGGGVL
jgi:hypothetical protein